MALILGVDHRPSIAVILPLAVAHARGILLGIADYFRRRPEVWISILDHWDVTDALFTNSKPSGIIAFIFSKHHEEILINLGVPVVSVANTIEGSCLPRVHFDDEAAGRLAATHLLDTGLRQFAFLGDTKVPAIRLRLQGFQTLLRSRGFDCSTLDWSSEIETWLPFDPTNMLAQLKRLPVPVGLFAPYDLLAYNVARVCHHGGVRVPEDVAIIGVDDDPVLCSASQPPLTSIRIPAREIGYRAAQLLDEMLAGREAPAEPICLAPMPPHVRMSTDIVAVPDKKVAEAVDFIRRHAHEAIGVAQLWERLRMDRKEMEHRFKVSLGRSAGEEFTRVRVERAKNLLLDTDWGNDKIAEEAGFSTASYLIRVFRTHVGVTPSVFRQAFQHRP